MWVAHGSVTMCFEPNSPYSKNSNGKGEGAMMCKVAAIQ